MFLICGLHNCGTSILAKCINSHPNIEVLHTKGNKNCEFAQPGNIWRNACKSIGKEDLSSSASYKELIKNGLKYYEKNLSEGNLHKLKENFQCYFQPNCGMKDNHLINYPNIICNLFPDAKKIIMVRNLVNMAISKNPDNEYEKALVSCMRAQKVIDDWKDRHNVLVVRFENFVNNPDKHIEKIVRFIDEKLDANSIEMPTIKTNKNDKWLKYDKSNKNDILKTCELTQKLLDTTFPLE